MAASKREEIEDAIIAAISTTLKKAEGVGYFELVGPYNGEIDQSKGPEDFKKRIRGRFPCCLVAAVGALYRERNVSRTRFRRNLTIEIYLASDHLRDRESRHRQDVVAELDPQADPGIFKMVEDIQPLLSGNNFDLCGVGYCIPSREDILMQEGTFTIWRLAYSIEVDANVAKRDEAAGKLTSVHIKSKITEETAEDITFNPVVEAIAEE